MKKNKKERLNMKNTEDAYHHSPHVLVSSELGCEYKTDVWTYLFYLFNCDFLTRGWVIVRKR